jgi:NAD(P)-dependent dehydrogenase (short-subunit alcohol dehydrogenase family)
MKSLSLEGRIALVTGSSRGLGRHIALQLARAGADVVVLARTLGESESAPGSVRAVAGEVRALGRRALEAVADVCDDDAVGALVARVLAEWGRIDILVNNAGVVATQPLLEMPPRRLDLLWRVNVRAPAVFIQACAPGMIERGSGHIVNIASLSSQVRDTRVPLGYAGYTATKSALVRLSQAAALELQPHGVAVNALAPTGLVETEGWLRIADGRRLPNAEPIEYTGRAVAWIVAQDPARFSGRFLDSQQVLAMAGILESPGLTFADLAQVDVSMWAES